MIGLLVVTHSDMAQGIYAASEMIMGKCDGYRYVSLHEDQDVDDFEEVLCKEIHSMNTCSEIIVAVDLFGATPMNKALKLMTENSHIEVVSGVNLPMVLSILINKEGDRAAEEVVEIALEECKESQKNVGQLLKGD